MPDLMSSSGVPKAPSASTTAVRARVCRSDPRTVWNTEPQRPPSPPAGPVKPSRTAVDPVSTVRLAGGSGGCVQAPTGIWPGAGGGAQAGRYPSTALNRRPSAMLRLARVTPQLSPALASSSRGRPSAAAPSIMAAAIGCGSGGRVTRIGPPAPRAADGPSSQSSLRRRYGSMAG